MKDNAIKTLTEKTGDKGAAEAIWKVFVDKVFGGMQPTEVMMKTVDKDDALNAVPVGYRGPLAALWPESAAPKDPPRGRKFKPEKARAYSAAEVVAFIAADPKVEGLRAEYMRRTGGEPALFYVDSKLAEAESADRIQRLFDRDPVAPFVTIGGRDVKPSGYPNDAPKEDAEDPYERGVALGQPGDVSVRLGVSLAGISHETRQAIRCAVTFDLADASTRELQADAAAAMGQSAIVYLANKPKAYREWPTWKKLSKSFGGVACTAPTTIGVSTLLNCVPMEHPTKLAKSGEPSVSLLNRPKITLESMFQSGSEETSTSRNPPTEHSQLTGAPPPFLFSSVSSMYTPCPLAAEGSDTGWS
jgi:hypothetical protein